MKFWKLLIVFVFCLALYNFSFTSDRKQDVDNNTNSNDEEIVELINRGNLTKEETIYILKTSYLFEEAIQDLGEDKVYEVMKDKITAYNLGDNRLLKRVYGKIIFEDSDIYTKLVGINYKVISDYGRNL